MVLDGLPGLYGFKYDNATACGLPSYLYSYKLVGSATLKIGNKVVSPFGLNYDVVDVGLNGSSDEVSEAFEHTALVRSPNVLQTERH